MASTVSPDQTCEAVTFQAGGDGCGGKCHSCALDVEPSLATHGNALMRNRAAPIGINVTVSSGALDRAGLGCSGLTRPKRSICHSGILRAWALMWIGAAAGVNGCGAIAPGVRITSSG